MNTKPTSPTQNTAAQLSRRGRLAVFRGFKPIAIAAIASVLTACGGGADGGSEDRIRFVPMSAEEQAVTSMTRARCEIDTPIVQGSSKAAELTLKPNQSWNRGRGPGEIDKLYNWGNRDVSSADFKTASTAQNHQENLARASAVLLSTDMADLRVDPGLMFVSSGLMVPERHMGVLMPSALPDQATGCVTPARQEPPGFGLVGATVGSLLWNSQQFGQPLSLATLPGKVLDAFEFVANFTPAVGSVAFFSMPKSRIADPAAMTVCRLAAAGTAWRCETPRRMDTQQAWVWAVDVPRRGVYVLVSTHARSGA